MRSFINILCLLLLASSTGVNAATDNANAVYNAIIGINAAVLKLTSALNHYTGGITTADPVMAASLAIHVVNRQGFAAANSSAPFTAAQSQRIANVTVSTVAISIPASVAVIEAKKPLFDAADLSSLILATIELLKGDHETFSAATGLRLTSGQVEAADGVAVIEAALVEAVAYYST